MRIRRREDAHRGGLGAAGDPHEARRLTLSCEPKKRVIVGAVDRDDLGERIRSSNDATRSIARLSGATTSARTGRETNRSTPARSSVGDTASATSQRGASPGRSDAVPRPAMTEAGDDGAARPPAFTRAQGPYSDWGAFRTEYQARKSPRNEATKKRDGYCRRRSPRSWRRASSSRCSCSCAAASSSPRCGIAAPECCWHAAPPASASDRRAS